MSEFTKLKDAYPHMVISSHEPQHHYDNNGLESAFRTVRQVQDQTNRETEKRLNGLHRELALIREGLTKLVTVPKSPKPNKVSLFSPNTLGGADYYNPFWSDPSNVVLVKVLIIISIIVLIIVAIAVIFAGVGSLIKAKDCKHCF